VVTFTHPAALTPKQNPSTHQIGGGVGSREGLDDTEKRKVCCPDRIRTPEHSAHRPVTIPTDYTLPRLLIKKCRPINRSIQKKTTDFLYRCQLESASCTHVRRRYIPPTHQMHAHKHSLFLSLKHTFRNSRMHVPGVRDFPITCQWIPSAWPQTATDFCQITMNRPSTLCSVL
jgi:hypothetical protein